MPAQLSQHAQTRLQQRGIPQTVVETLLDYGREEHSHDGSSFVFFDHRSRKRIERECGKTTYKKLEAFLDAYAVLGQDGTVITVGHRTHRINRN